MEGSSVCMCVCVCKRERAREKLEESRIRQCNAIIWG